MVVIDEAQNLTPSVLEEIRMLSNFETEKEKLIQIILIGQPELREKLGLARLEQFRQRVVLHFHIDPLGPKESSMYIKHRLKIAGNQNADIFTHEAIDEVYNYSNGVPRLINLVCNSALLSGFLYEVDYITGEIVKESASELMHNTISRKSNTRGNTITSLNSDTIAAKA